MLVFLSKFYRIGMKSARQTAGRATDANATHAPVRDANRALPTLRLSKGAVMWPCRFRGTERTIWKARWSGGTRAPKFPGWPQRSKFVVRPSLSSPNILADHRSAVFYFDSEKFELELPVTRHGPLRFPAQVFWIAGKIRLLSSRDERGSQRVFLWVGPRSAGAS